MLIKPLKPRTSIYEIITGKILAAVALGPGDPVLPWQRDSLRLVLPVNAVTGRTYRGVNILSLWVAALERGYSSGAFATLKQWNSIGATVRTGETATPIVFYREIEKTSAEPIADAEPEPRRVLIARGSWVFAAEQVEGSTHVSAQPAHPTPRLDAAECYFAATGARVVVGGQRACYRPATDTIHMPDEVRFRATDGRSRTESWYAVLGHEITHWVGASHRLDRDFGARFGDDAYCFEEATAELGAAFLSARLGIAAEPHPEHARYIHHWLAVMTANPRAIFAAAARAEEAVAYLDGLQSTVPRCAAA